MSFVFPEWRQRLARSLHLARSKPESKYVQLATYAPELGVQNRTVVFRGFLPDSHVLQCITEKDSDKYLALQHTAQSELCWYFPKTREQYRLSIHAELIDDTHDDAGLRRQMWLQLSAKAKASFIENQTAPIIEDKNVLGEGSADQEKSIPQNFILVLGSVYAVDYLILSEPHLRYQAFLQFDEWTETKVKP